MIHWIVRDLSCKPNVCVSWSSSELRVRLAHHESPPPPPPPPGKIFLLTVIRRFFFVGSFLFFFLSCLLYAFRSPAEKGLTSWLSSVMSICEVVLIPLVYWVRCGALLYRFLIFALFLTLISLKKYNLVKITDGGWIWAASQENLSGWRPTRSCSN